MRTKLILTVTAALITLAGPAATAASSWSHSGSLAGHATPALSHSAQYLVWLNAGESISALVTWPANGVDDLDIGLSAPGGQCTVFNTSDPDPLNWQGPDLACFVANSGSTTGRVTCPNGATGRNLDFSGAQGLSLSTSVSGWHTLSVMRNTGVPVATATAFTLDVWGGSGHTVATMTNLIRADICRGP